MHQCFRFFPQEYQALEKRAFIAGRLCPRHRTAESKFAIPGHSQLITVKNARHPWGGKEKNLSKPQSPDIIFAAGKETAYIMTVQEIKLSL